MELRPIGAVLPQIGTHRVRQAVPDGLPRLRVRPVQGVAQMDVAHQIPGIAVGGAFVGRGRHDSHEVALLLGGDTLLMGQLMADVGGQIGGGAFVVEVGLSGKGGVKAAEIQITHAP